MSKDQKKKANRIAILGWGSLIWDKKKNKALAFDVIHGQWQSDGPVLPLEFSRVSESRSNALTLVIDLENGSGCRVYWSLSTCSDVKLVHAALVKREGVEENPSSIKFLKVSSKRPALFELDAINSWALSKNLDFVVWTALPPNFENFSIKSALDHLNNLSPKGKAKAKEYITRSSTLVQTKLGKAANKGDWFRTRSVPFSPNQEEVPLRIFYSWQSDLPNRTNRNYIKNALEKSVKTLNRDYIVDERFEEATREMKIRAELDHDIKGVSGTPDLAATIFEKISQSDVFVADVSFVGQSGDGSRFLPNPNVLIELGYAFGKIGSDRVILVMNTDHGQPERLPFDIVHRRFPITYSTQSKEKSEKSLLEKTFMEALKPFILQKKIETPAFELGQRPSRDSLISIVLNSDSIDDWHRPLVPGFRTIAYSKLDVNLFLEVSYDGDGVQQEDFKEPWANKFPDPKATGYFVKLFYAITLVETFILVSVDGGRAMLPIPKTRDNLDVEPLTFKIAEIMDPSDRFFDYFYRAGLQLDYGKSPLPGSGFKGERH